MNRHLARLGLVLAALAVVALLPASAQAGHRLLPNQALPAKLQRPQATALFSQGSAFRRVPALATPGFSVGVPAGAPVGPCTETMKQGLPNHVGHNHRDPAQHQFECRLRQKAYLPLIEELEDRPDVVFGEMDIKADIAAVSITYPTAGAVFFDVSDPANPRFLDFYKGRECEQTVLAVNCGAFIDLSADGRLAFIAVQTLGVEPAPLDPTGEVTRATPGVDVIDISTIRTGGSARLASHQPGQPVAVAPEVNVGGSHTARSHVIPEGPEGDGRAPGEYLFAVKNFDGVIISQVNRTPVPTLEPVRILELDDIHDLFITNDPLDGRTYLYVAAGFASGFYVFDVTDPNDPTLVAEWDPTPQCESDWYAHTIDVTYRPGRRYVTLPAELFNFGDQSAEDRAEGCGTQVGNGDQVGPMWIVDASDFRALGGGDGGYADALDGAEEGDTLTAIQGASERALVATWTNPAERAGGDFTFSPHNQQVVGDTIFLSGYHSGVYALDASKAFSGQFRGPAARPAEIGFHTPHGTPARPIRGVEDGSFEQGGDSYTAGLTRGEIWDAYAYKGHVFAADMVGGFYSLRLEDAPAQQQSAPPAAATAQSSAPPSSASPQCRITRGLRSVGVTRGSGGARLTFRRALDRPVAVDVFQQSIGRRIVGERLVASFRGREAAVRWSGRANRRGRQVRDGYLLVRYTMRLPNGQRDIRRVIVRRAGGRFVRRPASERPASCGAISRFKLERPVFGGRSNRALGISFRLSTSTRATVTVLRGRRVVRRFRATDARAAQGYRLRFESEGRPRGDYRVRIQAAGATATLTARKL